MRTKIFSILLVYIFILSACAPVPSGNPAAGGSTQPTATVSLPSPTGTSLPTPVAPTPTPTHIAVDLTPAQRGAMQALSKKHNIPIDQIHLVKTEAVTWPSGCMGVVIPGVMCTNATVEGFKIALEANGQQYEYHTNQDGTSVIDAAQQLATLQLVVMLAGNNIQLVSPTIPLGQTYNPAFTGLLPAGGATFGTAYVLDNGQTASALSIGVNGFSPLDFIKSPTYGLALWRGGPNTQSRLAWGTQLTGATNPSTLQASGVDGSQIKTLLTQDVIPAQPSQLVAQDWSADGQTLYFSKEPVGLGGYIPFSGASSLYKIDFSSLKVTELIPFTPSPGPFTCLDAISADFRFVADVCTPNTITVRDLTGGPSTTIQPPTDATGFKLLGSARFSPDGSRLAFALAKGDPQAEQGWVAVSTGISGASKTIFTSPANEYDTVIGWLDDQTLLVQSNPLNCGATCKTELWMLGVDGSKPVKVAVGSFLTVIDNH